MIDNKNEKYFSNTLKKAIDDKLIGRGVTELSEVTQEQLYQATVLVLKDIMKEKRESFKKTARDSNCKKICYMCIEFLVGRSLKTVAYSLNLYNDLVQAIESYGYNFDAVFSVEPDPGLGNGGLGRLAACFMDSLSNLGYLANGYSLLYENGLFKQRIIDGEQIELPDEWLKSGGFWLVPHPEEAVTVKFGGKIDERWNNNSLEVINYEYDEVMAIPHDLLIPGTDTVAVNKIRLWRAEEIVKNSTQSLQFNGYIRRSENAKVITKQLYPNDDYDEGKLLRLTQQYFLVSASLQSIIDDYYREKGTLTGFDENIAIHINDTHPALCIPELMRIFMDKYSYSWDDAWNMVTKCVSYTNHTVLPEALETWRVDLFGLKLPRIYKIIEEINKRFTTDLWKLYPGDWDRISAMSIIAYNQIRMANLSIVGSHSVNGVSNLHSEILKKEVFHDYYKLSPNKFKSVTNGISHRRWLCVSNPELSAFLDELIGNEYRKDATKLSLLSDHLQTDSVLEKISEIKKHNKESFANFIYKRTGETIDTDSIFDVQIKRLHEYKRQLMNALKILALSIEMKNGLIKDIPSITFIFGCKAAPGYDMAKKIIKLISFVAKELNCDSLIKKKLKVIMLEDYNVSLAERLIPASDISEQISLAGKEASGTGCMKLMMNGALTLGTMDGANVEIFDAVGRDNSYIFGLNSNEVTDLIKSGYNSRNYYYESPLLKETVDRLLSPIGGQSFANIFEYLINDSYGIADPYLCLADFTSYYASFKCAVSNYKNKREWTRRAGINIAKSGIFSADNSIRKYADEIWHATPITVYDEKKRRNT